ncbi:unnamed protein product [Fraxinus pennsylvanica]|uniref:BHLH domain-containing protein n=1 Tax=Fraxinus pennsylvanica TaxID=56036 RepID=A0AAD1ZZN0_9LAMI|nr:unnamed protein product [Fraxinus pennsylvanica]
MELVWENGEVLIRRPSSSTRTAQPRPPCTKCSSLTKMKRKDGDINTTRNSKNSNSKTLYSTSSLNNCFESLPESYETNQSNPSSVHRSSFSIKKFSEHIMESRLIFSKPDNAIGSTSTFAKGESQPLTECSCVNLSKSVLRDPGSGLSAPVLPASRGELLCAEKSINEEFKVSTSHVDSKPFDSKSNSPPDQQSNIVGPLAESSKFSQGSSINPNIVARRNYQQPRDQSKYQSNRRRNEINKRLRILRELIPNCRKVDKTIVLDEAIEYLKTLQLQLQMMSVTAGLYIPLSMMLPPGPMQQIRTSSLANYPTIDAVRGLRMGTGAGCSSALQFPTSPISGAVATNSRQSIYHQMLGVPSSVSPVPMTIHPPLVHSLTRFSARSMADTTENIKKTVATGSNVPQISTTKMNSKMKTSTV